VEDEHTIRRCAVCGFPVDSDLRLDSPPPGFPSPPEVTILCVDDEPAVLEALGDALRFKGYRVVFAGDGQAALRAVASERPQLILLDILMPGPDGYEVCRRVKADAATRSIPVILLTGVSDEALTRRAFLAGADLALRKPVETAVVLRTVDAALSLAVLKAAPLEPYMSDAPGPPLDLSLPTRAVLLDFWTQDGLAFQAELPLHLQAESHGGPEMVQDRLNDADLFLSLVVPGEGPLFLNKIQVIRVDLKESDWAADFAETPGEVDVQEVRIQPINGEQLTGSVRIEGPAERRRLSDFLNTQPAFLPLQGRDRLHLLQKRFIARVVPRGHAA
jgi:CheY-like chemotaxis protein